jgi:hypothetical protein
MPPVPPQAMTALLPLRGDPQPALETLHQGLAVLLCPLIVPESPDLLGGESVYSLGDLLHVHLVVAGYREVAFSAVPGRPRPRRPWCGLWRRSPLPTRLPPSVHSPSPPPGTGRRWRRGSPCRPRRTLAPTPVRPPAACRPALRVAVRSSGHPRPAFSEVVGHQLGELLGQALLALPRLCCLPVDDPVGLGEGLGKAPGCLVDVAGLSSVHEVLCSFPRGSCARAFLPQERGRYARSGERAGPAPFVNRAPLSQPSGADNPG